MSVYRRPFDYASQNARIILHTTPEWRIDTTFAVLEIKTYPWTIGLSPTINMTVDGLTLTTYPWTIGTLFEGDLTTANISLTTYPWTIRLTPTVDDPWTGESAPSDTWTPESAPSDTWTPVTNPTGSWT